MSSYAVAAFLLTSEGIPLIRYPKKPAPVFWKLPGGRSEKDETAEACATREIMEETGVSLSESDLVVITSEDRGNHELVIFRAEILVPVKVKSVGDEGEEVRVFKPEEILNMEDFFPNHRKIVEELLSTLAAR